MPSKKQCNLCLKMLPATTEYFYKRVESADGLRGDCKECKVRNTLRNRARKNDRRKRQDNS